MRSRVLTSAVVPAVALPALAFGHGPGLPGFGLNKAVRFVTSTVSSIAASDAAADSHRRDARPSGHQTNVRYVALNCLDRPVVRPGTFELSCADGNDTLTKLHWTAWNPGYATATGTQVVNNCTPNCAQGRFNSYPIRVILWGGTTVSGHPAERRYTMVTLLYTGRLPTVGTGSSKMAGPSSVSGDLWS
jgi:hypothetical protein